MNKTLKIRKFVAEAICATPMIIGVILHIFFGGGWLATFLLLFGAFGFVLINGFNITKKYIKSKCSIGRKIRICYVVIFLVVTTGVILMIMERDFVWDSWGFLVFFGIFMPSIYLNSTERSEDFLLEEQERKRKFEADDDLEVEVSFENTI